MTNEQDDRVEIKNSIIALTGCVMALTEEFKALIKFLDDKGFPSNEYRTYVDQKALAKYSKMISEAVDRLEPRSQLRDLKPPTDILQ
jgi:hypothetical protein